MHEVLSDGDTGIRCQILHRGAFGGAGVHNDGMVHGAGLFQALIHADDICVFLTDGNVNADDILSLLVQNGIDGDGGFARAAVTDDEFALAAADRYHGVDTFQTGLERNVDGLPVGNARCFDFNVAISVGLDFALSVKRLTQRIDDAADDGFPDGDLHQTAGSLHRVAFLDGLVLTQKDDADIAFFEVQCHAVDAVRQFEQFAGHAVFQAVHVRDAVADFQDCPHFIDIEVYFVVFNLFFDDRCDFIRTDFHFPKVTSISLHDFQFQCPKLSGHGAVNETVADLDGEPSQEGAVDLLLHHDFFARHFRELFLQGVGLFFGKRKRGRHKGFFDSHAFMGERCVHIDHLRQVFETILVHHDVAELQDHRLHLICK